MQYFKYSWYIFFHFNCFLIYKLLYTSDDLIGQRIHNDGTNAGLCQKSLPRFPAVIQRKFEAVAHIISTSFQISKIIDYDKEATRIFILIASLSFIINKNCSAYSHSFTIFSHTLFSVRFPIISGVFEGIFLCRILFIVPRVAKSVAITAKK